MIVKKGCAYRDSVPLEVQSNIFILAVLPKMHVIGQEQGLIKVFGKDTSLSLSPHPQVHVHMDETFTECKGILPP